MKNILAEIRRLEKLAKTAAHSRDFATALKEDWETVHFDEKTLKGTARVGGLNIEFRESANDPAVIVTMKEFHFKTSSDHALEVLNAIYQAYRGT